MSQSWSIMKLGSQANAYVWAYMDTLCYIDLLMVYSVTEMAVLVKVYFWPLWPQIDPRLISDPVTSVEGPKPINMYESYCHTM